jgi:hypothetical protein
MAPSLGLGIDGGNHWVVPEVRIVLLQLALQKT